MNGLISIIVPVYNAESYLGRCLDSLINQTYKNIEIIVIDDGSTDDSFKICEKYAKKDRRIVLIKQENSGVSKARNNGLNHAKGEYIGFCDSDDWVEHDMYEVMFSLVTENDADIAIVGMFSGSNQNKSRSFGTKEIKIFSGKEAILEMHRGKLFQGQLWNKLFKKELFDGIRLNAKFKIFEDLLVHWPIFLKSHKVVFQDCKLYHYVTNPISALNQSYRKEDWQRITACKIMLKYANNYYPEAIPYVYKNLLTSIIRLSERMIQANKLKKRERILMQKKVASIYNGTIEKIMTPYEKKMTLLFLNHYYFYFSYVKIRRKMHNIKYYLKKWNVKDLLL